MGSLSFPLQKYPDLKIFQAGLKDKLLPGENVIADSGYSDERCEFIPEGTEAISGSCGKSRFSNFTDPTARGRTGTVCYSIYVA